jgi:membrane protease YdiL (CAAX protease family)
MNDVETKKKNFNIKYTIIIGLIISIPINFLINLFLGWDLNLIENNISIIIGLIVQWIIVLFLILTIIFLEKKSLKSIGLKMFDKKDVFWGFIVLVIQVILLFASERFVNLLDLVSQSSVTINVLTLPISSRIFMVFTAGITEEIIFRGYLIEKVNFLTNHLIFSSILSYIVFIIFHIPFWGIGGAIQISLWAIPITILYAKRRNLTTCIVVHLVYDGSILLLIFLSI